MSAPTFTLVGGQVPSPVTGAVTLALTIDVDPDNQIPGDLHLMNGQIHFWDGDNANYQKVVTLLKFFKGEWFLNTEEGLPYFQSVLVHNPNLAVISSIFRKALLAAPGAVACTVKVVRDNATRTATVAFTVQFDSGASLTSADFPPFVLAVPS